MVIKYTHPSSAKTFTAIRFAALAIPNLAPPAVPLFLSLFVYKYGLEAHSRYMSAMAVTVCLLVSDQ